MEQLEQERQRVEAEEKELVLRTFTHEEALGLGQALLELGRQRRLPIAVDVERCGHRIFHAALPGASPDNFHWIERKKNLVKRVLRSSYGFGLELRAQGRTLGQKWDMAETDDFAAHGGCFPIVVASVGFVGTVTVSGLPQEEDHKLAVEALRALATGQRAG